MSVDDNRQVESSADVLESFVRDVEQLEVAVDHRTTIGQAQGILMARLDIDADAAFDYLKRLSMDSNQKLIDIAEVIAETRALPDVGPQGRPTVGRKSTAGQRADHR